MNKLLNLIVSYRYERYEDQSYMALAARQKFCQNALPLLEKAFPDPNMLDQVSYELDNYVATTEISAYLDGIRDGIETFFFGNTSDDIA